MKLRKTAVFRSAPLMIKPSVVFGCLIMLLPASLFAATTFTIGFDTDGDTEGFSGVNVTGLTTSGGFLTGTASSGDPRLEATTALSTSTPLFSLGAGETWDTISFRVRETNETPAFETPFSAGGLVFVLNDVNSSAGASGAVVFGSGGITGVDSGDGFFTVSTDISSFAPADIRYLRFDPIGLSDAAGNFFEVDFVEITTVPEPSVALLGALGMFGLVRRRR